jgi:hypothetical protein
MLRPRSGGAILLVAWCLAGSLSPSVALAASPTELISNFRASRGLGRVTTDSTLNRIAQEQATAMAARDVLSHDLAGRFSSRMASSGSGRAAENIAYGHDSFPKTLDQWINSSGHRKNLLMPGASRVGVASARSAKTGRTYWAMVIAADHERPPRQVAARQFAAKPASKPSARERVPQPCRMSVLTFCLQR